MDQPVQQVAVYLKAGLISLPYMGVAKNRKTKESLPLKQTHHLYLLLKQLSNNNNKKQKQHQLCPGLIKNLNKDMSASFENKTTETSLLRTVQNNNPPRGKKHVSNFFLKEKESSKQ